MMQPSSSSKPVRHSNTKLCAPERTLIRFATLLGTYSLNEHEPLKVDGSFKNNDVRSGKSENGMLEKLLTASSCDALRTLFSVEQSISSFPSLSLCSVESNHGQGHDDDKDRVEALASSNLKRPILVMPKRLYTRLSTETYGEKDTDRNVENQEVSKRPFRTISQNFSDFHHTSNAKRRKVDNHVEIGSTPNLAEEDSLEQRLMIDIETQVHDPPRMFLVSDISKVPHLMLHNFSSSFSFLIEARLRAYAMILMSHISQLRKSSCLKNSQTRDSVEHRPHKNEACDAVGSFLSSHGDCITAAQLKLETLLWIGKQTKIDAVVTAFHLHASSSSQKRNNDRSEGVDKKYGEKSLTMPMTFESVIDLSIPSFEKNEEKRDNLTVSMRAPGTISGCFEENSDVSLLESVHMSFDTQSLLSVMVEQACIVVRKIVESANNSLNENSQSQIPETQKPESNLSQSVPLSGARAVIPIDEHPVVSPDFKSIPKVGPHGFSLDHQENHPLDDDKEEETDCAAIVDYAIGEISCEAWR